MLGVESVENSFAAPSLESQIDSSFSFLGVETVSLCSQVGVNHNGGHLLVEARDLFVVSKLMKGGTFSRNTLPASSDPPLHDCALGMRGLTFFQEYIILTGDL